MKRQIILALTIIAFSCFTNSVIAQTLKKKVVNTTVKKSVTTSKKSITTTTKKVTTATKKATTTNKVIVPTVVNNASPGYKCKVSKTNKGCSLVFELSQGTPLDKDSKGIPNIRKEYFVSYKDNAITEVSSSAAPNDKPVVKVEGPATGEENTISEEQTIVAIKDLSVVFDVLKDKKELVVKNGEATFPAKLPDGIYVTKVIWNWDMPKEKASKTNCSLTFKVELKGGSVVNIN